MELRAGGFNEFCKKSKGTAREIDPNLNRAISVLVNEADLYRLMKTKQIPSNAEEQKNMQSMIVKLCNALAFYFADTKTDAHLEMTQALVDPEII